MKKKIILASTLIAASTPVAVVVACNNSDVKNQVISMETQKRIKDVIDSLKKPFPQLFVGKEIVAITLEEIQNKIDKETSWVIIERMSIYKENATTGKDELITAGSVVEPGYKYRIDFIAKPTAKSQWENSDKPTEEKVFSSKYITPTPVSKTLDRNSFDNLKINMDWLKKFLYEGGNLNDIQIDQTGREWKDKVTFKFTDFEASGINLDNWYSISADDRINVGHKIRAKVTVIPKDEFGWKDGDNPFSPVELSDKVTANIQWLVDASEFEIDYANLLSGKIGINLFYGFVNNIPLPEAPAVSEDGWVEIYTRTSETDERSTEPETFKDYTKIDYNPTDRFNPEPGKIYMKYEIPITFTSPQDKYVNFKVVYKTFFKSWTDTTPILYILYDQDYLNGQLPFENTNNYHKIVRDGEDLVVYTYSMPYKIFSNK